MRSIHICTCIHIKKKNERAYFLHDYKKAEAVNKWKHWRENLGTIFSPFSFLSSIIVIIWTKGEKVKKGKCYIELFSLQFLHALSPESKHVRCTHEKRERERTLRGTIYFSRCDGGFTISFRVSRSSSSVWLLFLYFFPHFFREKRTHFCEWKWRYIFSLLALHRIQFRPYYKWEWEGKKREEKNTTQKLHHFFSPFSFAIFYIFSGYYSSAKIWYDVNTFIYPGFFYLPFIPWATIRYKCCTF